MNNKYSEIISLRQESILGTVFGILSLFYIYYSYSNVEIWFLISTFGVVTTINLINIWFLRKAIGYIYLIIIVVAMLINSIIRGYDEEIALIVIVSVFLLFRFILFLRKTRIFNDYWDVDDIQKVVISELKSQDISEDIRVEYKQYLRKFNCNRVLKFKLINIAEVKNMRLIIDENNLVITNRMRTYLNVMSKQDFIIKSVKKPIFRNFYCGITYFDDLKYKIRIPKKHYEFFEQFIQVSQ